MNESFMELYVEKCDTIEIYKECPNCKSMNNVDSCFCKMKECQASLTDHPIKFQWKVFLIIPKDQPYIIDYPGNYTFFYENESVSCFETRVFVSGSKLNPIMGMSCNDFIELSVNHGFETMSYLMAKYFYHSKFLIERGYDRIFRIILPKGCQFTFVKWLSMQNVYGFNYETIISEIYGLYFKDSDSEEESAKIQQNETYSVTNVFVSEFSKKNTKVFGYSPFPVKSNLYDIIKDLSNNNLTNETERENVQIDDVFENLDLDLLNIPMEESV